jgi:hypothetical protein
MYEEETTDNRARSKWLEARRKLLADARLHPQLSPDLFHYVANLPHMQVSARLLSIPVKLFLLHFPI